MSASEHSRRQFLSLVASAIGPVTFAEPRAALRFLSDEKMLRVGVFGAPDSENRTPAPGYALMRGIELGIEEAQRTAEMFGFTLRVDLLDENDLRNVALKNTPGKQAPYSAFLGGTDTEYCLRIAEAASAAGALYLNAGCTADRLRGEQCRTHVFHVASSNAMRLDAALTSLIGKTAEAGKRWLLLADKKACEELLPQVARYATQVGATAECFAIPAAFADDVLVNAAKSTRADVLIFPGDAPPFWHSLTRGLDSRATIVDLAGGETGLRTIVPHAGTRLSATDWHGSLERFGAGQLSDRFRARYGGTEMYGDSWSGWLAMKIAVEVMLRSRATSADGLISFLGRDSTHFDGHKGVPLSFRKWDHQLRQPVYVLRSNGSISAGGAFTVEEQPSRRPADDDTREVLDQLGLSSEQTSCRWDR